MIETEQTITVNAGVADTWDYSKNFERWASIMPGYQSSEIQDEDNSLWILKVGVGAMVRVVKVRVHVERWAGPERVDFSFKLDGDPVMGSGSYVAVETSTASTQVSLHVRVAGSGPMAPMWEAMGAPILPKFAKSFAAKLKERIEYHVGVTAPPASAPRPVPYDGRSFSLAARFLRWLRSLFGGASAY